MSQDPSKTDEFFVASHDVLFARDEVLSCDACGRPLTADDDADGSGPPGSGVYLWTRGSEVRVEKAPLCAACAAAIGVAALARWEIEEEEG